MILVRNIHANRVNLSQNDVVAGLPSVSSFMGLIGGLADDLGFDRWGAKVTPIIHEVNVSDGRTKPEFIVNSGVFSPSENPEDIVGDVRFSLLVDLDDEEDLSARDVLDALMGKRFCGGISWLERSSAAEVAADGSALSSCPRGYALFPVADAPVSDGRDGGFFAVADVAFPAEKGGRMLLPAAVGYRHIESREDAPARTGVRSAGVPHIFTCPLTGVIEAVNVRKKELSDLSREDLAERMFRWHYDRHQAVIHQSYSA